MKAIIIEDKDCRALLESLKLQSLRSDNLLKKNPSDPATLEEVHSAFLFVVVRWMQSQGGDCRGY